MENSKFFQKIWRFNAIIIALAGLLAVIALLIGLTLFVYGIWRDRDRNVQVHDVVNTSPTEEIKEVLELGYPEIIAKTGYLKVDLISQQNYSLSYSKGKTATSTRNMLFINTKNNESRWLLNSHSYLLSSQNLYVKQDDKELLTGFLYEVTKADTNGDNRLTHSDKSTIAISKTDGSSYQELIEDIDYLINVEKSANIAYILYKKSDNRYLAMLNMQDLTLIKNSKLVLPELPNNK